MAELSRDVLKWIQSLDLTWQIKTPKWDFTNGYLVAEIFSWYFPQEIEMHMYNNGVSLDSKQRNWFLLKNFFKQHKLEIPPEYVEGTIHCKEGSAPLLINRVYELLTNRPIRRQPGERIADFTDHEYQQQLPMHARSTASAALKNNLRMTELMADRSIILSQQKAHHIISEHVEHRRQERIIDPERFDRKATLGELAVRHAPASSKTSQQVDDDEMLTNEDKCADSGIRPASKSPSREPTVSFKEVQVQQLSRPSGYQQTPINGC